MTLSSIEVRAVRLFEDAERAYDQGDSDTWREKRGDAKELLEDNDFEYLGVGDYRLVYGRPDGETALKLAKSKIGRSENKMEARNWGKASDAARVHLARILDSCSDGKWLVQERVDADSGTKSHATTVNTVLNEDGLHIAEIDVFNVGVRPSDGRAVAYDYAGT